MNKARQRKDCFSESRIEEFVYLKGISIGGYLMDFKNVNRKVFVRKGNRK